MKFVLKVQFIGYLALISCTLAQAQADQSSNFTAPQMIYHGTDIENVSTPMRNLHVTIPLLDLKGRGMNFAVNIYYNSKIWSSKEFDDPNSGTTYIISPTSGAWSIGVPRMGTISGGSVTCPVTAGQPPCQSLAYYADFRSEDGSVLHLPDDSGLWTSGPTPSRYWSSDGSYMRIPTATGAAGSLVVPKLIYKDGVSLNQHLSSQQPQSSLEDTNGNTITCSWTGGLEFFPNEPVLRFSPLLCTDTIGRTISFSYINSQLQSISYKDSSDVMQTINFTWQVFNLDFPWDNSNDNSPSDCNTGFCHVVQADPTPFLTQISLPNGRSYSFEYVTTATGVITGEIAKIILPTGGYIRYDYNCTDAPCAYDRTNPIADSRTVHSRTVSTDGTVNTEVTWSYGMGSYDPSQGQKFTTTDPLGNVEASWFAVPGTGCLSVPSRIENQNASGTIMKQVINAGGNDLSSYTDPGAPTCNNPRITSTTTILPETNLQSATTLAYGTFGDVTEQYDYDWGSGGPGPLLRHTSLRYQHDSNASYGDLTGHILDRVTSKTVFDGANNPVAQTTTSYDDVNPTQTTNVVQHDYTAFPSTNKIRGNPTKVNNWLSTSNTFLTTGSVFNDVGNLLQVTDPKLNVTSFSYTDNFASGSSAQPTSAFPTQVTRPVTNGVSHIQRSQYYFNTGLMAATCGENFPSGTACASGLTGTRPDYQSIAYDLMGRPRVVTKGDGGQATLTYNEASLPINVGTSTTIDSTHNLTSTTIYDGLGRQSQTQLTSDPSGTTYQLTKYDELGRKKQVFNPTRCNPPDTNCGEVTWGYTSFVYDGLGRATQVISPDGGITKSKFAGNVSTVTDQAGKQSQSVTDGLGRVVEVDEPGTPPPPQVNHATQQTDGNFVLYNSSNTSLWSTGTAGTNASSILMQDDGNLVVYIFKWSAGVYATPSPGPFPSQTCSIGTYLVINQRINANQCIVSPHGQYMLYMAPDGNFYIYDIAHAVGTWGPGTYGHPGAYAILQGDGNLCVYDANNVYLWCSGTNGTFAERLDMEDDGRIIIYKSAWNSGTSTGQFNWTNLSHPGCDVGIGTGWTGVLGSGQCFVSPNGHFELLLQTDGNLVIYDLGATPANALWSSNTGITPLSPGYAYVTKYSYDALDNLICVEQHGDSTTGTGCSAAPSSDAASPWRVRRFVYDSLSRLTSSSNPESNTATVGSSFVRVNTTYSYDADGNLFQKTSPAPNQTGTTTQTISYCYDSLNRITGKVYAQQSCPLTSPVATYSYDQASFNGLTISNGIGRRTGMSDQAGAEAWSYDSMGRPVADRRTIGSVTKSTSYVYNFGGGPTSITYPSARTIAYAYNNAAEAISATDTPNSINYATLAAYSAAGSISSLKNGTNLTSTFYYNNRLQPCRIFVSTGTGLPSNCADSGQIGNILDFTYNFSVGAGDNGNVTSITNNRDAARNQSFAYDSLNRINSAQTGTTTGTKCFGESFGYDAWGTFLTIGGVTGYSGCTQENLGVAATIKNQISTNAYDTAGNMIPAGYTYDAENHLLTAGGVTYTYDGDGKRLKKSNGKLYWYGMGADTLDETDLTGSTTNSAFNEYVFFNGKRIARRNSSNTVFYYFADHLGTSRAMVQAGQTTACYDADFYPFGGERTPITNSCPQNYKFTGKERDSESGLDDFGARYYSNSLGRLSTPDDFLKDSDVHDPQSWNKYAYTRNNPLRYIDPTGGEATVTGSCDSWRSSCDIKVTATIAIYTKPGQSISNQDLKEAAASIQNSINQAWSGSFSQNGVTYNVSTNVTVTAASSEDEAVNSGAQNVIAMVNGPVRPGTADSEVYPNPNFFGGGQDRGTWNIDSMMYSQGTAQHEFGHLLGVGDREGGNTLMDHNKDDHWTRSPSATSQDFKWAFGQQGNSMLRNSQGTFLPGNPSVLGGGSTTDSLHSKRWWENWR